MCVPQAGVVYQGDPGAPTFIVSALSPHLALQYSCHFCEPRNILLLHSPSTYISQNVFVLLTTKNHY